MLFREAVCMVVAMSLMCSQVPTAWATQPPAKELTLEDIAIFTNKKYSPDQPEVVIAALRDVMKKRELMYGECLDYATASFLKCEWDRSLAYYEIAASKTQDAKEKALALLAAGQSAYMSSDFREAGMFANAANSLLPTNKVLPAYREYFWKAAGDELEARCAQERLKQTNMELNGTEVMIVAPGTAMVVVKIVSIAASLLVALYQAHKTAELEKFRIERESVQRGMRHVITSQASYPI